MPVLTPAQFSVGRLYAVGIPAPEIARRLGIKPSTVRSHKTAVRRKLGLQGREGMAEALLSCVVRRQQARVSRLGLLPGEPVRIEGGRFHGRTGFYLGHRNSEVVRVRIGGGEFLITARFVHPNKEAA